MSNLLGLVQLKVILNKTQASVFSSESKLFRVRGFSIELRGFCFMLLLFLSSVWFAFCAKCTHSEVAEYIHLF